MNNKYTKQYTIDKLNNKLADIKNLYKAECINWKGKTNDTHEFYTEVIAQKLYRNIKEFKKFPPFKTRKSSYCRNTHSKIEIDLAKSNRGEENFAKRITGLELEHLGLIKDFQIPLKDTAGDTGLGKIDLISFNKDVNTLFLIELKYIGNLETLLRASLEIYSYYKIIDQSKLKKDYKFSSEIVIKPAVLLVPNCTAYKELKDMSKRPMLKKLSLKLGVNIFTLELSVYAPKL